MFYVGQKVVAVPDEGGAEWFVLPKWRHLKLIEPVCGVVYTVREVRAAYADEPAYLVLEEVRNRPLHFEEEGVFETGWPAHRFRPVVERKADISIFTNMLQPEQVPA